MPNLNFFKNQSAATGKSDQSSDAPKKVTFATALLAAVGFDFETAYETGNENQLKEGLQTVIDQKVSAKAAEKDADIAERDSTIKSKDDELAAYRAQLKTAGFELKEDELAKPESLKTKIDAAVETAGSKKALSALKTRGIDIEELPEEKPSDNHPSAKEKNKGPRNPLAEWTEQMQTIGIN